MNFEEKLELFLTKYLVKDFLSRFVPAIVLYLFFMQFQLLSFPDSLVFQIAFLLPIIWCFGYAIEKLNKSLPLVKDIYISNPETNPLRAVTINHFLGNLATSVIWLWIILVLIHFLGPYNFDIFTLGQLTKLIISLTIGALLVWVAIKQKKLLAVDPD